VGLTPELLPMIMTITLARGAVRLSHESVIVKNLPSIHNLGAMDVLCTDKTGTLTEARIALTKHVDMAGNDSARVSDACLAQQPLRERSEKPARRRDPRP
jgi:Mg2+-importing ATPase